jgi:hypothetical protein
VPSHLRFPGLGQLLQEEKNRKEALSCATRAIQTLETGLRLRRDDLLIRAHLQRAYALRALVLNDSGRTLEALPDLWRWRQLEAPPKQPAGRSTPGGRP